MLRKGLITLLVMACLTLSASDGSDVATAPTLIQPLLVSAIAPDAALVDPEGNKVNLSALTKDKVSVIVFYRGDW